MLTLQLYGTIHANLIWTDIRPPFILSTCHGLICALKHLTRGRSQGGAVEWLHPPSPVKAICWWIHFLMALDARVPCYVRRSGEERRTCLLLSPANPSVGEPPGPLLPHCSWKLLPVATALGLCSLPSIILPLLG